jgi:hypothetical protein
VRVEAAEAEFVRRLAAAGKRLPNLTPRQGIAAMLDFYREQRAEDCDIEQDGDMLLYQWGCCDWGAGLFFELDITRQFVEGAAEDGSIVQLSLTFRYPRTELRRKVGDGNRWCSTLHELESFRAFILESPALAAVEGSPPAAVLLHCGGAE